MHSDAEAAQPTLEEVLKRAGGRSGGSVPLNTAVAILRGEQLAAPGLVDLEVASVLRRQATTGAVDVRRANLALHDLAALPLQRARHRDLLTRCWALKDNLTPYDAAYVALAEVLHVELLTGDRRLARAPGPRCRIEVLPATP